MVYAVALLAVSALHAAAPSAARIDPRLDRTALYEARLRSAHAHAPSSDNSAKARALLDSAQALVPEPRGMARLGWREVPPEDAKKASARVDQAWMLIAEQARREEERLEALAIGLKGAAREDFGRKARAQLDALVARRMELGRHAAHVSAALAHPGDGFWARSWRYLLRVAFRDAPTDLSRLRARFRELDAGVAVSVLGSELNYVQGALRAPPLALGKAIPAYMAADTGGVGTLEDTAAGREVELSAAIKAKASDLVSTKAALEFVRNEERLDWYAGSMKGTTETLREGRGNDVDLAALLIALLRAQGTPARYVRGNIELPLPRLAGLMGLVTAQDQAPGMPLSPAVRDLALRALTASGISFEPMVEGGQIAAVRLLHVWVEAFVPYSNYRGAGNSPEGKQWVPLEPSIPGGVKYAAISPQFDILAEMGTTPAALTDAYLGQSAALSPVEYVQGQVIDFVASHHPDLSYGDVVRHVVQRREELPYLPGSLPYKVSSVVDELAFLPDTFKHRAHIVVSDAAGAVLDVTVPVHRLAGHRAFLAYEPATPADGDLIGLSGGLADAPAALVQLVPTIRLDGHILGTGSRPVGLGVQQPWRFELLLPDGSTRSIGNRIVAGNSVALGVGGPGNKFVEPDPLPDDDSDADSLKFLYARAAEYSNAWTQGEEELAGLLGVVPVRPTANVVFVENQVEVQQALGIRNRLVWKGVEVDADLRTMVPLELSPARGAALLRLAGYEGSYQEQRILAAATKVDSVSAVTVLQEAARRGLPVLRITPSNVEAQLPLLATSPVVLGDVADLVARGREVIIPAADLTIRDWTGTGYIARDPKTEEGGYFLSGSLAGGVTVVSPNNWADPALLQLLQPLGPDRAVDGGAQPDAIFQIVKIASTDFQQVKAGGSQTLTVLVTTSGGLPVRNATVRFTGVQPAAPAKTSPFGPIRMVTGPYGTASVVYTPDAGYMNGHPFINVKNAGDKYFQSCGWNEVQALVDRGALPAMQLGTPFAVITRPAEPAAVRFSLVGAAAGTATDDTIAVVFDGFLNPIANRTVDWTATGGMFLDVTGTGTNGAVMLGDPRLLSPLSQVTNELGRVVMKYVPGNAKGSYSVTATVKGTNISDTESVLATIPPYLVVASVAPQAFQNGGTLDANVLDGVFSGNTPIPWNAPVFVEVLKSTGTDVASWVSQPVDQFGLRLGEYSPVAAHTTAPGSQYVTSTRAVFWPNYRKDGAVDTLDVRCTAGDPKACASGAFVRPFSARPVVSATRTPPGAAPVDMDPCGSAFPADELIVRVSHPSGVPIYARIESKPVSTGEALLRPIGISPAATGALVGRVFAQDANYLVLDPAAYDEIHLNLSPTSSGGQILVHLYAQNGQVEARADNNWGLIELDRGLALNVKPSNGLVGSAPGTGPQAHTRIVLPVRNFASAAKSGTDADAPEAPMLYPATMLYCAAVPAAATRADVSVRLPEGVIAQGQLQKVAGNWTMMPAPPDASGVSFPTPQLVEGTTLAISVPPSDMSGPAPMTVDITPDTGNPVHDTSPFVTTEVIDAGASPRGHLFVKNVSVVDGHLIQQTQDIVTRGRSPSLSFTRSYTSRGMGATPLGQGWSHSYYSYAISAAGSSPATQRYLIMGGDGTGGTFNCPVGISATGCRNQRGTTGRLTFDDRQRPIYTAASGVVYRFGDLDASFLPPRYQLVTVTDPGSNLDPAVHADPPADPVYAMATLEYGGAASFHEVHRVWSPGNGLFLQFSYQYPPGATHAQLRTVELRSNGNAPSRVDQAGAPVEGVPVRCMLYGYDINGMPTSANLYDGMCPSLYPALDGSGAPLVPVRTEGYAYQTSTDPEIRNNLITYTDPHGHVTSYLYHQPDTGPVPAELLYFGKPAERVQKVIDARMGTTTFSYFARQQTIALDGATQSYRTEVQSPRAFVTKYWMDSWGAPIRIDRPFGQAGPTDVVTTLSKFDDRWETVGAERDAIGRSTLRHFDENGFKVYERVDLAGAKATGDAGAVLPASDGAGAVYDSVVERWEYDGKFGKQICHMDREGRITLTSIDPPSGVVLRVGHVVERANLTAAADETVPCSALATGPAQDGVIENAYCTGAACPLGAQPGDRVSTTDSNSNVSRVVEVDPSSGQTVREGVVVGPGQGSIVARRTYDATGRLHFEERLFGTSVDAGYTTLQRTQFEYDALDRPTLVQKFDLLQGSAGEVRQFAYGQGGLLTSDTDGYGLVKTTQLDDLDLPSVVTLKGPRMADQTVTTDHDADGNPVDFHDARGIRTHTTFDAANLARTVQVSIESPGSFQAAGGEGPATPIQTAAYGYDAAGNKVFERDFQGYETTYVLDTLSRVAKTVLPAVPGPQPRSRGDLGADLVQSQVVRRYDRVGNKVFEQNGNQAAGDLSSFATAWTYDFRNAVTSQTDAEGRRETRTYDGNGNLHGQEFASIAATAPHLVRVIEHDALNRPTTTTETVLRGRSRGGSLKYVPSDSYDDENQIVDHSDRRGAVTREQRDGLGRVVRITVDPTDAALDPGHPLNLVSRTAYDAGGHVSMHIDPLSRETDFLNDALGRVIQKTLPALGLQETFAYDPTGRPIQHVDLHATSHEFSFDMLGRPIADRIGGERRLLVSRVYDDARNPSSGLVSRTDTDAKQVAVAHFFDGRRREVQTVAAGQRVSHAYFDATSRRATVDANGFLKRFSHDQADRPKLEEDDDGSWVAQYTKAISYDDGAADGRLSHTETDHTQLAGLGIPDVVTVRERDGLDRVERVARGGAEQVELTDFDGNGIATRIVDANLNVTTFAYDAANRKISQTAAANTADSATTNFQYDAVGNLTARQNPRTGLFDVQTVYDDLNHPVRVRDALGNVTLTAHDERGNLVCEKSAKGPSATTLVDAKGLSLASIQAQVCTAGFLTRRTYDDLFGKLTSVTDPSGAAHQFFYDAAARLTAVADGNGSLTTYEYDERGLRKAEHQHLDAHAVPGSGDAVPLAEAGTDPDAGIGTLDWVWTYDGNGNVATRTDPKRQTMSYSYGALDRLVHEDYAPVAADLPALVAVDRSYDVGGALVAAVERKQTAGGVVDEPMSRTLDDLGRVIAEQRYDGKSLSFAYFPHGERQSVIDPDGVATVYTYDGQNRLASATLPDGVATYGYFKDGLLQQTTVTNAAGAVVREEARCYDAAGKLGALVSGLDVDVASCTALTTRSRFDYTYDANGNRLEQTELATDPATNALRGAEVTQYGYDELDRLTGVQYPDHAVLYQYDGVGNRVGERELSGLAGGLGPEAFATATGMTKDVAGSFDRVDWLTRRADAISGATTTFAYDLNGNLSRKVGPAGTRELRWDVRNTLTAVFDNGVEVGRYDYDRSGLRVKRAAQGQQVEYVLDDKFVLSEHDGNTSTHAMKRRYHYGTGPLAESDVSGASRFTTWLFLDALGSVAAATESGGTIRSVRRYDAWGKYTDGTAPGSTDPKLGYTGHQFDPESGLVYARARYYDSDIGMFLSRDPHEAPVGKSPWLHRYVYVQANPLRYTDADGLDAGAARALSKDDLFREQDSAQTLLRLLAGDPEAISKATRFEDGGLRVNGALRARMGMFNIGVATASAVFVTAAGAGVGAEFSAPAIADSTLVRFGTKLASDVAVSGVETAIYANLPELTALTATALAATTLEVPGPITETVVEGSLVTDGSAVLTSLPKQARGVEFDPSKLAGIQKALERTGVVFNTGEEAERYLSRIGAQAAYMPDMGKPGILWLAKSPSRTEVVEELLHLGQDRVSGWRGAWVAAERNELVKWEIAAQEKLLTLGPKLGWSAEEIAEIARARNTWQSELNVATSRTGGQ